MGLHPVQSGERLDKILSWNAKYLSVKFVLAQPVQNFSQNRKFRAYFCQFVGSLKKTEKRREVPEEMSSFFLLIYIVTPLRNTKSGYTLSKCVLAKSW